MYILAEACSDASFAATVLFIKRLIDIIFIIGPVLLILLLTIDFTKAVMANNDNRIKQVRDTAIKRVLFAVALLFVPLIVDTSFGLLDKDKGNVISCYNKVDMSYVTSLATKLEAETKEKEAQRQKTIEEIIAKQESEAKKRSKLSAAAKKIIFSNNSSSSNSASTNNQLAKEILDKAEEIADEIGRLKFGYYNTNPLAQTFEDAKKNKIYRVNCNMYVIWVMQEVNVLPKKGVFWLEHGVLKGRDAKKIILKNKKVQVINVLNSKNNTVKKLVKSKKLVPGDIVGATKWTHTMIYKGKTKNGKYEFYSIPNQHPIKASSVKHFTQSGDLKIGIIIHPVSNS